MREGAMRLARFGAGLAVVAITGAVTSGCSSSATASGAPASGAPATSAASATPATSTAAPATATATPAAAAAQCTPAASTTGEPVGYRACGVAARNVGIPVYDAAAAKKTYTLTLATNRGTIVFTANGAAAPYTVYSFVYLAKNGYFNQTKCHRLTTAGIYVLQCGDPTGTGSGGPGYEFQDENLTALGAPVNGEVTYPAGTVAMANAGPDTNGSQFFLVYKNSPLAPDYTPFGTITLGLSLIQQVAAAGTNNANGPGDGAPNESVEIESATAR
ncbi:MAG TPA: peptidylprolyl isomerase [Streptosporangiaceae bacterium]|nr:peptidylprolyl isomerase [Streptosporangiaceae bacterium]